MQSIDTKKVHYGKANLYAFPSYQMNFAQFPLIEWKTKTEEDEKKTTQNKYRLNEFGLIVNCWIVTAEADVEFTTKLSARGINEAQMSGLQKPSMMLTSLEDYVRNVFTR